MCILFLSTQLGINMTMENKVKKQSQLETIHSCIDKDGWFKQIISIDVDEIVERNFTDFIYYISTLATGSVMLLDVSYKAVGCINGNIQLEVSGDPSAVLEELGDIEA